MFPSDKIQNEKKGVFLQKKKYFAKQFSAGNYVGQNVSNNMTI